MSQFFIKAIAAAKLELAKATGPFTIVEQPATRYDAKLAKWYTKEEQAAHAASDSVTGQLLVVIATVDGCSISATAVVD